MRWRIRGTTALSLSSPSITEWQTRRGAETSKPVLQRIASEREIRESCERADEAELPRDEQDEAQRGEDESPDAPRQCHRRGCTAPATFVVLERYQEETGHGAVEVEAFLCIEHTAEESPTNLDESYADYVFRVEPIA